MPTLVSPAERYKPSFLAAVREAQATGSGLGDTLSLDVGALEADFPAFLESLRRFEPGHELPDGFVHSEARWLVDGGGYLGRVSLRHTLNGRLHEFGGHIGYEVRPSAGQKGYATLALQQALDRARELGLTRVLVTCDQDNLGSRRVVEKGGGVLEAELTVPGHPKPIRRYWISL